MTRRLWYSGILIVVGFNMLLLLTVDYYCLESAIANGHFWAPVMAVEPQKVDFGDVSADSDVRWEIM